MKLLEWHAKDLFAKAGIPTPEGYVVRNAKEAAEAAERIGRPVMLKSQVRTGGRGKAGGILKADNPAEAAKVAESLFGKEIKGHLVGELLVEEQLKAAQELYIGFTIDYDARRAVMLFNAAGGVNIEESSSGLLTFAIDPLLPLPGYKVRELLAASGIHGDAQAKLIDIATRLYGIFQECDATTLEINPLILLEDGRFLAADGRMVIDDSAIVRQPGFAKLAASFPDTNMAEQIKLEYDFDYIELNPEGSIGLVTTGAGGTMMTIDMITRAGGKVINFADVRTGKIGKDPTRLIVILEQLAKKPNLKVLLVSIFGAITDLSALAEALVAAFKAQPLNAKILLRLQGRNEDIAREILEREGFSVLNSLEQAVETAVSLSK